MHSVILYFCCMSLFTGPVHASSSGNLLSTKPNQSFSSIPSTETANNVNTTAGSGPTNYTSAKPTSTPTHASRSPAKAPLKLTEDMLENAVDIPDMASVPRLSNSFNRTSAVRLKTDEFKASVTDSDDKNASPKLVAKKASQVTPNGHVVVEGQESASENSADTSGNRSKHLSGGAENMKTEIDGDDSSHAEIVQFEDKSLNDNGKDKIPTVALSSPISVEGAADADTAETDSIGDVLDGELPYNRELKESK